MYQKNKIIFIIAEKANLHKKFKDKSFLFILPTEIPRSEQGF